MESMISEVIKTISDTKTLVILATIFIIADIISGYIKAFKLKTYNSSINRDGIAKKMMWYLMMIVGVAIEFISKTNAISIMVCATCCITEFMSIIENAQECDIELPLSKYLGDKEEK